MIRIEETEIYGWKAAIRGARNSFESWDKSDSVFHEKYGPVLGNNDIDLLKRLVLTNCDAESKWARFIIVTCDVTAPLYWWKEMDTYKVGTVCNSTSTMHSIQKHEFTKDMFSMEHMWEKSDVLFDDVLDILNTYRKLYFEDAISENPAMKKEVWWQMIQMLPTSFNQKRTMQFNYQNLRNIYFQRKGHRLDEWHEFCDWVESLPYAKEFITCKNEES